MIWEVLNALSYMLNCILTSCYKNKLQHSHTVDTG